MDHDGNSNGESCIEHQKVTMLQVLYNHEDCTVSIGAKDVPLALAQMMVFEAAQQLEIMRRQAATMEMLSQRAQAAQTAQVIEDLKKRR